MVGTGPSSGCAPLEERPKGLSAFVPNFAELAVSMNKLLRKGISFDWTDKCEEWFIALRQLLTSPPILIHPEIGGHFHILTDASDTACGVAVCHRMNDLYRPIAFWRCTLRDAELNYTVTEKEALAVVKALKNYEDMLQGAKVTIVTDHKPLNPLLQAAYKAPSARLRRWALAKTDFDFDIIYKPGATSFLPDYLSRVHHNDLGSGEFEPEVGCELFSLNLEEEELSVMQKQMRDRALSQVIQYLEQGELSLDCLPCLVRLAQFSILSCCYTGPSSLDLNSIWSCVITKL